MFHRMFDAALVKVPCHRQSPKGAALGAPQPRRHPATSSIKGRPSNGRAEATEHTTTPETKTAWRIASHRISLMPPACEPIDRPQSAWASESTRALRTAIGRGKSPDGSQLQDSPPNLELQQAASLVELNPSDGGSRRQRAGNIDQSHRSQTSHVQYQEPLRVESDRCKDVRESEPTHGAKASSMEVFGRQAARRGSFPLALANLLETPSFLRDFHAHRPNCRARLAGPPSCAAQQKSSPRRRPADTKRLPTRMGPSRAGSCMLPPTGDDGQSYTDLHTKKVAQSTRGSAGILMYPAPLLRRPPCSAPLRLDLAAITARMERHVACMPARREAKSSGHYHQLTKWEEPCSEGWLGSGLSPPLKNHCCAAPWTQFGLGPQLARQPCVRLESREATSQSDATAGGQSHGNTDCGHPLVSVACPPPPLRLALALLSPAFRFKSRFDPKTLRRAFTSPPAHWPAGESAPVPMPYHSFVFWPTTSRWALPERLGGSAVPACLRVWLGTARSLEGA
ncbi:hypothetical protein VDGL01_03903 [Verticillium dahliae]